MERKYIIKSGYSLTVLFLMFVLMVKLAHSQLDASTGFIIGVLSIAMIHITDKRIDDYLGT